MALTFIQRAVGGKNNTPSFGPRRLKKAYEKKSELALVKGVKPKSLPLRLASRWGRPKLK